VTSVADTPGTGGVEPTRVHLTVTPDDVPASLVGASVLMTVSVESTDGDALAVPVAALSVGPRGLSRVQVVPPKGDPYHVNVRTGLTAKSMVAVTALDGRLKVGDLVVIGRGAVPQPVPRTDDAYEVARGQRPKQTEKSEKPAVRVQGETVAPEAAPAPAQTRPARSPNEALIADAPAGFVELTPATGPAGAFDLETFLRWSEDPAHDRALLDANHFVRGHVRSWLRPGPREARMVAAVFDFESASDAVSFMLRKKEQTIAEDGGVEFTVKGGTGLRYVHRASDGLVHGYVIAFHVDERLFFLGAFYPNEQPPDEILAMEDRQRARFAAGANSR
jgi:hypothetical protein